MTDADLAARLALAAGRLLLQIRDADLLPRAALGKTGDQTVNQFLSHALHSLRGDDGLLSEETRCDGTRLAKSRVWIIDPVDGTAEYAEGRSDWAVHVGLAIDGVATTGAVALPARDRVFRSDTPVPPTAPGPLRLTVSRSRPPREAVAVAEALDATLLPMGSAGAKAMAVVMGEADIYLHSGGQSEWDSCAPVAVAAASGLHCSRIDGSPLRYNRPDVALPDLLICRPELAPRILALLA